MQGIGEVPPTTMPGGASLHCCASLGARCANLHFGIMSGEGQWVTPVYTGAPDTSGEPAILIGATAS
jgi:hypothetical protein